MAARAGGCDQGVAELPAGVLLDQLEPQLVPDGRPAQGPLLGGHVPPHPADRLPLRRDRLLGRHGRTQRRAH
eukprot:431654-Prymnesium_polylepis.1